MFKIRNKTKIHITASIKIIKQEKNPKCLEKEKGTKMSIFADNTNFLHKNKKNRQNLMLHLRGTLRSWDSHVTYLKRNVKG